VALGIDHPYIGGDGPPVQQQAAQRRVGLSGLSGLSGFFGVIQPNKQNKPD
jgi:hypothetical protein